MITVKYNDGGSQVLRNVCKIEHLGDEIHYFIPNTDQAVNHVTVTNQDDVVVRCYNTQSFNAI